MIHGVTMSKPSFTDADKRRFRKAGETDRWYVVQVGRHIGPRRGWSGRGGCEESVKGYRGAIFHGGWASRSEAEDFFRTTDAHSRGGDDRDASEESRSRSTSPSRKRIRYRRSSSSRSSSSPSRPRGGRSRSPSRRRRSWSRSRSRPKRGAAKSRSRGLIIKVS